MVYVCRLQDNIEMYLRLVQVRSTQRHHGTEWRRQKLTHEHPGWLQVRAMTSKCMCTARVFAHVDFDWMYNEHMLGLCLPTKVHSTLDRCVSVLFASPAL